MNGTEQPSLTSKKLADLDTQSLTGPVSVAGSGDRFAVVQRVGNKRRVVVNGQPEKWYDEVAPPVFSPDGRRLAYAARKARKWIAVVDGTEGEAYRRVATPIFSHDGSHVAYGVRDFKGKTLVVVDGKPGKRYASVSATVLLGPGLLFTPNNLICYSAKMGDSEHLVVGAREAKAGFLSIARLPVFSKDGRRMAYVTIPRGTAEYVVIADGQQVGGRCDFVETGPLFSPNGKRLAYVGTFEDGGSAVVIDGVRQEPYSLVPGGNPVFSPDSRRLAYLAAEWPGKIMLVVDGKAQRLLTLPEGVWLRRDVPLFPVFSPDNRRIACAVPCGKEKYKDKYRVIVDGKVLSEFPGEIPPHSLAFSSDSARLVYVVQGKDAACVVVQKTKGKRYDSIRWQESLLSPDGRRVVYIAKEGKKEFVVVGKTEGPKYDAILVGRKGIVFDSPNTFHYIGRQGNSFFLVTEKLTDRRKRPPK